MFEYLKETFEDPYLSNTFTVDRNRYVVNVEIS